jgi:hypothetical protein
MHAKFIARSSSVKTGYGNVKMKVVIIMARLEMRHVFVIRSADKETRGKINFPVVYYANNYVT